MRLLGAWLFGGRLFQSGSYASSQLRCGTDRGTSSSERSTAAHDGLRTGSRRGRTRPDGAGWAEVTSRTASNAVALAIPAILIQDGQPVVSHVVAEGFDFLLVDLAADAPFLRIFGTFGIGWRG